MTPTRPELSRNAISRSPSSISRIGAPFRSSSADDAADPRVARIALDRLPDRLAELVAPPRRRLVRRKVGVDEHRHYRQRRIFHQPLADKGKGMTFTFSVRQRVGRDRVELAIDEG